MATQFSGDDIPHNQAGTAFDPLPACKQRYPATSQGNNPTETSAIRGPAPVQASSRTAHICELIDQVLRQFARPYPADIIDQVSLAIENDLDWLTEYFLLVDAFSAHSQNSQTIVNDLVSMFVLLLTGMVETDQIRPAQSRLLAEYTVLRQL